MQHPLPLPYRTESVDRHTTEQVEALRTDIFAVLDAHGFSLARMAGPPCSEAFEAWIHSPTTVLCIV